MHGTSMKTGAARSATAPPKLFTSSNDDHGDHRHFHRFGQRLRRFDQDADAEHQGKVYAVREGQRQGSRLPHFRRRNRLCAAWKKTVRDTDREYLSVKLDDPSFPAPIYASLVKVEGEQDFTLIWSRRSGH